MHPWHDAYIDDSLIATAFPVVIEIPLEQKQVTICLGRRTRSSSSRKRSSYTGSFAGESWPRAGRSE
jgi:hypothetical protein